MRSLYIILFILLSISISANTYYVAPTGGNDSNPGTLAQPWATWQKGFTTAIAGDTVYFRGGTWYPTSHIYQNAVVFVAPRQVPPHYTGPIYGNSGTAENPIVYMAYPADWATGNYPILDLSLIDGSSVVYNTAMSFWFADYLKIIGLTVRNVWQATGGEEPHLSGAMGFVGCSNFHMENMILHDMGGRATYYQGTCGYFGITSDTTRWINCDIYNCADTLSLYEGNPEPFNGSDGFKANGNECGYIEYIGCRVWNVSDDGFDIGGPWTAVIKDCWSFSNGWYTLEGFTPMDGNGIKFGGAAEVSADPRRLIINNISAYNFGYGLFELEYAGLARTNSRVYNNTIYRNGYGIVMSENPAYPISPSFYRNNIVYKSRNPDQMGRYSELDALDPYYASNNTWNYFDPSPGSFPWWVYNDTITITDADFVMVDSLTAFNQLSAPRKSDGSLPEITFLKLASTSDMIDAGIQIPVSDGASLFPVFENLEYRGSAPDLGAFEYNEQIIADHTVVDKFDDIPSQWIDSVKKMWVTIPGESHSEAYRVGLTLLESSYPAYAVNVAESGNPEAYTTSHLRASRATWGNYSNSSGWIYDYGEEDWWTNSTAVSRTKAGITYSNTNNLEIAAIGFGWCWDMVYQQSTGVDPVYDVHWYGMSQQGPQGSGAPTYSYGYPWGLDSDDNALTGNTINMDTYLSVTQEYVDYCETNGYDTKVFFTTGPVDTYYNWGEAGYQGSIKQEYIRDYVKADTTRILFDYADILCYDDNGAYSTVTWDGNTYPIITNTNYGDASIGHISSVGAIRLAKAMWWMLARIAGWDGQPSENPTATNILSFTLTSQIAPATIDTTNHTVSIEVTNGTNLTNLSPTITLSYGATINPASGTSQNFTLPVVYTVTALDGVTEQEWVVTVTEASGEVILVTSITVLGTLGLNVITTDGGTLQLSIEILPVNATNQTVTWSVTNGTGQATISSAGLVTAVADGTVMARATANDGSAVYDDFEITISGQGAETATSKIVRYRGKIVKR